MLYLQPPENQLRLENRQLSEHELRVQRSLSKLNVPDWYRKHQHGARSKSMERPSDLKRDPPLITSSGQTTTTALKLLKRNDYGSSGGLAGGWAGLSAYRTPSLSSLQNARYAGKSVDEYGKLMSYVYRRESIPKPVTHNPVTPALALEVFLEIS